MIIYEFFQGEFREENFSTAMQVLQDAGGNARGDMGLRGRKGSIKGLFDSFLCFYSVNIVMSNIFTSKLLNKNESLLNLYCFFFFPR